MLRIKSSDLPPKTTQAGTAETDPSSAVNQLLDQECYSEAYPLLQELLRRGPDSVRARTMAGLVALKLDRSEEAEGHFEAALELAPDDYDANHNLSLIRLMRGRVTEALAPLRHLRRLDPDDLSVLNDLGVVWSAGGRTGRALAAFSRALYANPEFSQARNSAVQLCLENDRPDLAARFLARHERRDRLSIRAQAEVARWRQLLDQATLARPAKTGDEEPD